MRLPQPETPSTPLRPAASVATPLVRSLAWLSRIPSTVARKAPKPEQPGVMPFVRLGATLLMLLFVGWSAWFIGMWPLTIVFVVACVAGFIGARNVGRRYTNDGLGRFDAAEQSADTTDATSSPQVPGVLGNPSDPREGMLEAPLKKSTRTRLARARQNEALLTEEWLDSTKGFETVSIVSGDGTQLVGHALVGDGRGKWLVYAHDYHASWTDGLQYARHYAQQGYSLLFVEMRAHGESGGDLIGMGYLDSRDLVAWCRKIVQDFGEGVRIALHGSSMGAAAAIMAASDPALPAQVRAVVSEGGYTDAWNAIIALYHGLGLDVHPAIDLVRRELRGRQGGYDLAMASPIESLGDVAIPVLFAHAAHDTLVPAYFSVELYREARNKHPEVGHAIASFDHGGHNMSSLADSDEFYRTLFGFLEPRM